MAKRAQIIVKNDGEETEIDPEMEQKAEELVHLNESTGGDLYKAIDELSSTQGVMMQFTRVTPADKAGYAGEVSVSEFTLEHVKQKFGAGRYSVRFKGPKGYVPGGGPLLIAPDDKPRSNGVTDVGELLATLEKSRAEKNNRLLELSIPVLGTVLAALVGRQQTDLTGLVAALKPAPGPSLTDLVTALSSMKNLQGSESSDPVDRVLKIMDAVKGFGGSEQGETNWTDVVRELVREGLPMAKGVLENVTASQAQQVQQRQQNPLTIHPLPSGTVPQSTIPNVSAISERPQSAPSVEPSSVILAGENGEMDMLSMFKPMINEHLGKVLKWAQDDRNPQAYAEVFMDELPQIISNYITPADALKYMQRTDWFHKVVEFYPALESHHGWCEEFRGELMTILVDQIQESSEKEVTE